MLARGMLALRSTEYPLKNTCLIGARPERKHTVAPVSGCFAFGEQRDWRGGGRRMKKI